jgi:hypothetical protein
MATVVGGVLWTAVQHPGQNDSLNNTLPNTNQYATQLTVGANSSCGTINTGYNVEFVMFQQTKRGATTAAKQIQNIQRIL